MLEYVVGIDIGSSKVYAAIGKLDENRELQIVGISSAKCSGVKKGTIVNINETAEAVGCCIDQIEEMIETQIDEVYISFHDGLCEFIENKGVVAVTSADKKISNKDIRRADEEAKLISISPTKKIIGVINENYSVDRNHDVKNPVGMIGMKLEVNTKIITAEEKFLNNFINCINLENKEVAGIIPNSLAVSQIMLDDKKKCTAFLDVGSQTIDISIYKNKNLCYTSIIPLGGNNITNDISICLKISYEEAEEMKVKYGSLIKEKDLNETAIKVKLASGNSFELDKNMLTDIIEARVEELFEFIKVNLKSSDYFNEIEDIIIIGGGMSLFRGIDILGENILEKSIKIGIPQYMGAASPLYATCVGIVKYVAKSIYINNDVDVNSERTSVNANSKKEKYNDIDESKIFIKIKDYLADFFNIRR